MLATVRKTDYTNIHVDQIVTNQAMEMFQNDQNFLCVRDVPVITVDIGAGVLSVLDRNDLNRDEMQPRGRQSQAEKAGFAFKDLSYKTDERSLEYDLAAGDQANASPGRNPALVIPMALSYKAKIHTEVRFAQSVFAAANWYRTVTGGASDGADNGTHSAQTRAYWNLSTTDVVAAIRQEIDTFLILTGMLPTSLRFGRQLWTAVSNNPYVRAQISVMVGGTSLQSGYVPPATTEQLSQLLGLKVSVSSAVYNTANKGAAAPSNAFIVSPKDALLSYDAPTQYTDGKVPTAFARVVNQAVAPNGFQVRTFQRPEIAAGGSTASVLDIYNGFLVVDNQLATYFSGMSQ